MDSHITEVVPALGKSVAAFTIWDTAVPLATPIRRGLYAERSTVPGRRSHAGRMTGEINGTQRRRPAPIRSARPSRHLQSYRRTHCVVSAQTPQPPPRGTRRIGVPNPERRRCTSVLRQRSRHPWRLCSEAEGVRSTFSRESRECLATTLLHRCFPLSVSGRARCESWSPQARTRSSAGPRNRYTRSLSTHSDLRLAWNSRNSAAGILPTAATWGATWMMRKRSGPVVWASGGSESGMLEACESSSRGSTSGGVSAGTAETSRAKSWAWRSISASAPKAATLSLCTYASMARADEELSNPVDSVSFRRPPFRWCRPRRLSTLV